MPPVLPRPLSSLLSRLPPLLPSACALCGGGSELLCAGCRAQFFSTVPARCRQCAIALPPPHDGICGQCLKTPPPFDATVVAADYLPPIDQLVLALKFGHQLALAPLLARLLHETLRQHPGAKPQLLLPVPLGPRRLAQRGFNQALEIARPLARLLAVPLEPRLALRVRETDAQATLPPRQRRQNLRGAFALDAAAAGCLRGRHVGIVDDVITTGSTAGELAAVLKRFGAARVTNLMFARTPPH